jgi:AcrR family transcriptional regulator
MSDTKRELLTATRRVLTEHGFHGLTTQRVADAAGVNQSLVHYHFDTKVELVVAFIEMFREQFELLIGALPDEPGDRLAELLALIVRGSGHPEVERLNLAVYELEAYAGREATYQESLREYSKMLHTEVSECIEVGISDGTFYDRDPEATARLLLVGLDGAMLQEYSIGTTAVKDVLTAFETYVLPALYIGDVPDIAARMEELDIEALAAETMEEYDE